VLLLLNGYFQNPESNGVWRSGGESKYTVQGSEKEAILNGYNPKLPINSLLVKIDAPINEDLGVE
jgi:hypothetical protein